MGKEARPFSGLTAYAAGDLCLYGGTLYAFTTSHQGAWNASHVREYDDNYMSKVSRIINGAEAATKATAYANTVVMEMQQITGDRYRYVLTNAADPRL